MAKRAGLAILVCAVIVLVAAVPLVAGTTLITKGEKGPNASAVTWEYVPAGYGIWTGNITNNGLRSLVVDVYDNTTGVPQEIMHQRIRFAAYDAFPTGTVVTQGVIMAAGHIYSITGTPNGPRGTSATVVDEFKLATPPVAMFTPTVTHMTVAVDGSGSYDDVTIVSYSWDWGDQTMLGSGVTATHTYALAGTYTIKLTVTDNDGLTNSASKAIEIIDLPPVASFTFTVSGLTVSVDASGSSDDYGIVKYAWSWGDGTTGTGVTATHTYAATPLAPAPSPTPSSTSTSTSTGPPPPPFLVMGQTLDSLGNVVPDCAITITNMRTGAVNTTTSESLYGYYEFDLNWEAGGWLDGDIIKVTAVKGALSGETQAPIVESVKFLVENVVLTGPVPYDVSITLTVTDALGQTASVTKIVTVTP